ncbi:MerR family transcriptional regulator [Quadrisphaera setariae]|uniref:MerR family transcriptional regulator n=1 Tax=Quadrisphaera setariae TaxID=2593304 RepID=UPI0016508C20|nr:helix-turn-helix domain-containing protein [Quadrisphaera setariae]
MLTIGQFAQATGLTAKALRLYDETGLLEPAEVDPVTGYRRYEVSQVRRAAQVAVMRRMGVPLEDVGRVLDQPDAAEQLLDRHAEGVRRRHAAEEAALVAGRAQLAAYERDVPVEHRRAPAQPWAGVVVDVPADPEDEAADLTDEAAEQAFSRLWSTLTAAGAQVTGPWWTTMRTVDGHDDRVQLVLSWPLAALPESELGVEGARVETGVLPERTEALVRLLHAEDHAGDGVEGVPTAAVVHLLEQLGDDEALDTQVRQVGVLDEQGAPVGVELVVTTAVHG